LEPAREEGRLEDLRQPRAPAGERAVQDSRPRPSAAASVQPESRPDHRRRRPGRPDGGDRHCRADGISNDRAPNRTCDCPGARAPRARGHPDDDGGRRPQAASPDRDRLDRGDAARRPRRGDRVAAALRSPVRHPLMYEAFYGLRERPFDLTPNPRFLLKTAHHREALTTLEYGLSRRTGIALLVGEAGTGKTTIVHTALQSQTVERSHVVYLNNPSLTRTGSIEFRAAGFDRSADAAASKTRCLAELTEVLATRHAAGTMAALIIDEAQCLPDALLEEIRLLANIESASEKLLSIILAG